MKQNSDNVVSSSVSVQDDLIARGKNVLMNTYATNHIVLTRGKGSFVTDANGKKYLDFAAGIAVNSLGHCNDAYVEALKLQLQELSHCSNLYFNEPAIKLAEALVEKSPFDRVFLCNSGTEAIEACIKLARKYSKLHKGENASTILSMANSFHGRSYGALTATGQSKYQEGYEPLVPNFQKAVFNDFASIQAKDLNAVAAIIVEPIQGEGGIHPCDREFLKSLRKLCTDKNIVLIFDEIQCGIGRTGKFFAFENFDVVPDVIALAKGLGGGFPIGAVLANENVASAFKPGDHGSTFGGNALASTAGLTCVTTIRRQAFLDEVHLLGQTLQVELLKLKEKHPQVADVRGMGLMQGIELNFPVKSVIQECADNGLLLVSAGETVIRFVPPLTVSAAEIQAAIMILDNALTACVSTLV